MAASEYTLNSVNSIDLYQLVYYQGQSRNSTRNKEQLRNNTKFKL